MPLERIKAGSVRRKIIFVFLTVVAALALSYTISRVAFREMMARVDHITAPDPRLELVQQITRDMIQTNNVLTNKSYSKTSTRIMQSLDSLASLNVENQTQLMRIDSIKFLLRQRDSLFNDYLALHETVVRNPVLRDQLSSLEKLIDQSTRDSVVRSTESQKVATTITEPEEEKDERSWFSRVFGSRRASEPSERRVVQEEVNVQIDTITRGANDSTNVMLGQVVQKIQSESTQQRTQLLNREMALAHAENTLTRNIFIILLSVEQDAFQETARINEETRLVVNESVSTISFIFIIFIIVIAIMIYLILADIRKSNLYRQALEEAKEEAEHHANAKQRFLSNMSHELRTPLQSIIGFSEQLNNKYNEEQGIVTAIHHSSEHLLQIVNEILDYSRINSGKLTLENQSFDFAEVIRNITDIMKSLADKKQLNLQAEIDLNGHELLWGDVYRIRQILFNLLSNAIKFTETGAVTMSVHAIQSAVSVQGKKDKQIPLDITIVVKDTGIGIPEQDLDRVFTHFEQSNFTEKSIQSGSGLGLSIVKAICEGMGGTITVESEVGKGTSFTVQVPLWTAPAQEVHPEADANQHLIASQTAPLANNVEFDGTLWLVDDDALILNLCEMILEKHGIPYKSFSSPETLLQEKITDDLSGIIMDIRMPGLDGYQLNRMLREKIAQKQINRDRIKLYAFTAQALPEEQESIRAQGFDDLLLKPFREEDLLKLLGVQIGTTQAIKNTEAEEDILQDNQIIALFVRDTLADTEQLLQASGNAERQSFIFHRLAGRIGQFGNNKLSFQLKKLEIDTRSGDILGDIEVDKYIAEIKAFVSQVKLNQSTEIT